MLGRHQGFLGVPVHARPHEPARAPCELLSFTRSYSSNYYDSCKECVDRPCSTVPLARDTGKETGRDKPLAVTGRNSEARKRRDGLGPQITCSQAPTCTLQCPMVSPSLVRDWVPAPCPLGPAARMGTLRPFTPAYTVVPHCPACRPWHELAHRDRRTFQSLLGGAISCPTPTTCMRGLQHAVELTRHTPWAALVRVYVETRWPAPVSLPLRRNCVLCDP